ncbi:MAG: OsmC family protein [Bacteroidales bacterium]|nr:OsmC family protein [Bacteroidales bacterium]
MKDSVNVSWIKNMAFEAELGGHKIIIDADTEEGGDNLGTKPKPLMLVALAGCTGMDVVSLMRKMRVNFDKFNIRVDADLTEEHPKHYIRMHIIYEVFGKDLPYDKIQRAVELSQDKYCGVSTTYRDVLELTYKIELNEV